MGYLEVQNRYEDLAGLFSVPDERHLAVVALTETGQLFFSNAPMSDALVGYYFRSLPSPSRGASLVPNPVSGAEEILAGSLSSYTGIRVVLAQDKAALLGPLAFSRNITFLIGILIVAVSLAYNLLSARQLTRPLLRLKERMESTELANLPDRISLDGRNDEIAALNLSFQRLRERLTEAVQREVTSHSLQLEARLDSLQAQVNPHFIYNVLTVLASRGLQSGDEEIVAICDGLAAMLRYSTSTARRSATIAEEIIHVRTYLSLMKQRLEHRLEYRIDAAEEVQGEPIPKIVLQQITENSLTHGYRESQETMLVTVRACVAEPAAASGPGSRWRIDVQDNGQGFSAEKLAALEARFREIDTELAALPELPGPAEAGDARRGDRRGHAIGGMGLVEYVRSARAVLRASARVPVGERAGGWGKGDHWRADARRGPSVGRTAVTVILVEDEPTALRYLRSTLEMRCEGCQVVATAGNGTEALSRVRDLRPDVVITDIRMPGMNGIELAERLKREFPDVYSVIVSGYQDFEYARGALHCGVVDYLLKPVRAAELRTVIAGIQARTYRDLYDRRVEIVQELAQGGSVDSWRLRKYLPYQRAVGALLRAGGLPSRFSPDGPNAQNPALGSPALREEMAGRTSGRSLAAMYGS